MRASPASPVPYRDLTFVALFVAILCSMAAHAQVSRAAAHAEAVAKDPLRGCEPGPAEERVACMERAIAQEIASATQVADALARINAHARGDWLLARRCHMLLHEQGRTWRGELRPGEIEHDGKDCAAGFLHGWMLANLGAGGALDAATVRVWCAASATPLERADCEHGMGHVLVRNQDGDLPRSLRHCRTLGDERLLRNCASGAFMENRAGGRGKDAAAHTEHWRAGEPWQPCRATPGDLLDVCAAWGVRDVPKAERLAWCAALPARVDDGPCRIAVGVIADTAASGAVICGEDARCWFGRGYAWAMLGWQRVDGERGAVRCTEAPSQALRTACGAGVGFRRAASLEGVDSAAAARACATALPAVLDAGCRRGALQRTEPIAYA